MSYAVVGPAALGQYFAPASRPPHVDLGPTQDWTARGRESRQTFERGLQHMLRHASSPRSPFPGGPNVVEAMGQYEQSPNLRRYQVAQRELQAQDPVVARELAEQAAMIGRQADLRAGRHLMMGIRRPTSGLCGVDERVRVRYAANQLSDLLGTPVSWSRGPDGYYLCVYALVAHTPRHYQGYPVLLCEPEQALADIWSTPAAPPGASFQERARIGVPTWVTGAPLPEHIL